MYKFFLVMSLLLLLGCESYNNVNKTPSVSGAIVDSFAWYSDMTDDVIRVDVTIPVPNDHQCIPYDDLTAPSRACTLADIDGDTDSTDTYEPTLHVKMQADGFVSGNEIVNAVFEQKGKTTRHAVQKSYRMKLDSKTVLFKKERVMQLNKHPNDTSRVRNKLAFDLFKTIPNFPSLKTQFVNLWINGVDYGLYTHVEKVGKEYLLNRGWNVDDNLYKAQNFDFRMVSALELTDKGVPANPAAFDEIIEVERGDKQTKLVEMLRAINQESMSDSKFMEVFNKYFNRDNYITWMAINIVVGNKDTVSQNFFLFNPLHSDTFYFSPWDYDGSARETKYYAKWELGIATWWGIPLHQGFLTIKANRDDLDAMVKKIRSTYITPATIQERLDVYKPLMQPYLSQFPDVDEITLIAWNSELDALIPRLDENIANYEGEFGVPMPFWQSHEYTDGNLILKWDAAVDFEGDKILYDVVCADNPDFNNTIVSESNMSVENGKISVTSWGEVSYSKALSLNSGDHYFMKVTAREENNASSYQEAFDKEVIINNKNYFGVLEFIIE